MDKRDFPGGLVVKTLPPSAAGVGALVGELRSHMSLSAKKKKKNQSINQKQYFNQTAQTLKMVRKKIKWIEKKPERAQCKCEDVLPAYQLMN